MLKIIAHRGGTSDPKLANQLEAFQNSDAEAWETDLHMTRDGTVILLHDNTLRSRVTAYGLESDLSTKEQEMLGDDVSTLTYDQITKLTGGHINTLDDLLKAQKEQSNKVDLLLEIKGADTAIVKKLKERLSHFDLPNILFICFYVAVIKELRASGFENRIFLLTRAPIFGNSDVRLNNLNDIANVKSVIQDSQLDGVGIEYKHNDEDVRKIVENLRAFESDIQIHFWVHKENECNELFLLAKELDVNYCNSDSPKETLQLLQQKPAK